MKPGDKVTWVKGLSSYCGFAYGVPAEVVKVTPNSVTIKIEKTGRITRVKPYNLKVMGEAQP